MVWEEERFLITLGIGGIICLIGGLHGIFTKKRSNNTSSFYRSVNILFGGVTLTLSFLAYSIFLWLEPNGISQVDKNTFFFFMLAWFGIIEFVVGIHGILNKEKINSLEFDRFSEASLYSSIIIFIGLIFWVWLWGWPWNPHTLFEWQKNPQAILNKPLF